MGRGPCGETSTLEQTGTFYIEVWRLNLGMVGRAQGAVRPAMVPVANPSPDSAIIMIATSPGASLSALHRENRRPFGQIIRDGIRRAPSCPER